MTDALKAVSPLRRRMIDDMSLRNLSPATQRSYLHAVTKFSRYSGRSPDRLGLEDVRAFQVYLVSQGISWPVRATSAYPLIAGQLKNCENDASGQSVISATGRREQRK